MAQPFSDPAAAAHFAAYPSAVRRRMLTLRQLVFDTAARLSQVGGLQETLKWGQPAYVTAQTKSGSTLRMDWSSKQPGRYALYVHCQTDLVERFRRMFPNDFVFEGNRALVLHLPARCPPTLWRCASRPH